MSSTPAELEPQGRELTQFLSYRVVRLHHALNAQALSVLERIAGLTLAQWRVLALVGSGTATTARDIARKSIIDPAMISRTVRGLEDAALLETRRPDSDRRVLDLRLTADGVALYRKTLPYMQARQQGLLEALEPGEREAVFRILEKLELAAERREFAP